MILPLCLGGGISAGTVPTKALGMKGRIRGFFIPAGRERGAELVYTLLPHPPPPLWQGPLSRTCLVSGRPVACPAPVDTIQLSRSIMSRASVSEPIPPIGTGTKGITFTPGPTLPAILVIVSTRMGGVKIQTVFGKMGHGANQDQTARGEGPMRFAEAFESVVKNFLQLPQLTGLHPYDDGSVSVTCRGRTGGKVWSVRKMTIGSPSRRLSASE